MYVNCPVRIHSPHWKLQDLQERFRPATGACLDFQRKHNSLCPGHHALFFAFLERRKNTIKNVYNKNCGLNGLEIEVGLKGLGFVGKKTPALRLLRYVPFPATRFIHLPDRCWGLPTFHRHFGASCSHRIAWPLHKKVHHRIIDPIHE